MRESLPRARYTPRRDGVWGPTRCFEHFELEWGQAPLEVFLEYHVLVIPLVARSRHGDGILRQFLRSEILNVQGCRSLRDPLSTTWVFGLDGDRRCDWLPPPPFFSLFKQLSIEYPSC